MSNVQQVKDENLQEIVGCWPFRRRRSSRTTPHSRGAQSTTRQPTHGQPMNAETEQDNLDSNKNSNSNSHNDIAMNSHDSRRPPHCLNVRRELSPLLSACWQQDWEAVLANLTPPQIYHRSHHTGRTALHLATMPGTRAPEEVLEALIQANPYAVVTEDFHQFGGTPLHFCCGSLHLRQKPRIVKLMVETARMVQTEFPEQCAVRPSFWSPLYQAAKYAAPAATLYVLVQAAARQEVICCDRASPCTPEQYGRLQCWIAPWTGAESWQREQQIRQSLGKSTRDSPLLALWRRQLPKRFIAIHGLALDELRQVTMDFYAVHHNFDQTWEFLLALEEGDRDAAITLTHKWRQKEEVVHWCKLLVLLSTQANTVHQLVDTVVSLYASIPPLVRLVTTLWPEMLLPSSPATATNAASVHVSHQRLPLHLAVERFLIASLPRLMIEQVTEVVHILALAQPQALAVPDPYTDLPAFLQVASSASQTMEEEDATRIVDLVYTLVRPVPTLIVSAVTHPDTGKNSSNHCNAALEIDVSR